MKKLRLNEMPHIWWAGKPGTKPRYSISYTQHLTSSFLWVGCAGIFSPILQMYKLRHREESDLWEVRQQGSGRAEARTRLLSPRIIFSRVWRFCFLPGGVLPCLQFFLRVESPLCFQASGFPFLPFCHPSNSPQASSPLLALVSLSLKWAPPFSHSYLGCCHFSPSLSDWASTVFSQTLARNCT